ncbi:MAG: tetratricopeptide repeat protein, partial [Deltaproteobacteria bacterium]
MGTMRSMFFVSCALCWVACAAPAAQRSVPIVPATPAVPAAAPHAPVAADEGRLAQEKFTAFSKEIERVGQDESVDAGHLQRELQAIVEVQPTSCAARFNLTVLMEHAGDANAARLSLERLQAEDEGCVPARENLAALAYAAGDTAGAMQTYEKIVAQYPKNVTSRLALARLLVGQSKYEEAMKLCRQVLQREADAIEAFRILGRAYLALGQLPMADLVLSRGLRAAKQDAELLELS